MAVDVYELLKADEKFQRLMKDRDKFERDRLSDLTHAKREGLLEGKLKGEIEAKMKTAEAMLGEGFSVEVICRLTNLNIEEVKSLIK